MLMTLHLCARITASVRNDALTISSSQDTGRPQGAPGQVTHSRRTSIFNEFPGMLKIHFLSFD
jgi:hypothetical protein